MGTSVPRVRSCRVSASPCLQCLRLPQDRLGPGFRLRPSDRFYPAWSAERQAYLKEYGKYAYGAVGIDEGSQYTYVIYGITKKEAPEIRAKLMAGETVGVHAKVIDRPGYKELTFETLGKGSMKMIALTSMIENELDAEVPVREVMVMKTIGELIERTAEEME